MPRSATSFWRTCAYCEFCIVARTRNMPAVAHALPCHSNTASFVTFLAAVETSHTCGPVPLIICTFPEQNVFPQTSCRIITQVVPV